MGTAATRSGPNTSDPSKPLGAERSFLGRQGFDVTARPVFHNKHMSDDEREARRKAGHRGSTSLGVEPEMCQRSGRQQHRQQSSVRKTCLTGSLLTSASVCF